MLFLDFYHFCEIYEPRVAHETGVPHYIDFISYKKHFTGLKYLENVNLNHAVFVLTSWSNKCQKNSKYCIHRVLTSF